MNWLAFLDEPAVRLFARALLVCAFLGLSAGLLGCVLVVRRMALMTDALAHSLLPGVALAWLIAGQSLFALIVGGMAAGLVTAIASGLISRLTRLSEDTAFAGLFAALFALGVLIASATGSPGDLQHLLFGEVLAVGRADLIFAAVVAVLTLLVFTVAYRPIMIECFDPDYHRASGGRSTLVHLGLLALTVVNLVAALHALGVVLALGLFMLPAATTFLWCERWPTMLVTAPCIGIAGCIAGFAVSWTTGLASGPCMVAALGAVFVLSTIVSPRHGIVGRWLRPAHHHREEDDAVCELPPVPPAAADHPQRLS